ncbi:alkyl sulfatase dimerization domain-containing protein [Actinospongicola halichondriae]|uniref:alkyl sulfatase dimerization domain-containing protein n=1 Tax=Actinospongicola halichondriae TaxID=3236844 RepID=UPI003D3A99E0
MTELLARSARYIDEGVYEGPQANNPMDSTFHEVADGIGMVCAFSHVWALHAGDGLTVFDTSMGPFGAAAVSALRGWRTDPFASIVYTHGHVDHVTGTPAFLADAAESGHPRPRLVAHENAPTRFDRYEWTQGYNQVINARQFGGGMAFPADFVRPDDTFRSKLDLHAGETTIELHHDRGETDDHAWAWVPEHKAIFSGDLFIWVFPNAGNPQKVQRYAADWAVALRKMIALEPELLLPAHGLPIAGKDRIASVLDNTASALEGLIEDTVAMMNRGATLDEIVHTVTVPERYAELPYLRGTYDEPEFVVRNIWRLYGGWYDGNPARLKPPKDAAVASEVAALAGGAAALSVRAVEVAECGDLRLACQLAEWAAEAVSDDGRDASEVHANRAEVYRQRRDSESSLMAKGIFGTAATASEARTGD